MFGRGRLTRRHDLAQRVAELAGVQIGRDGPDWLADQLLARPLIDGERGAIQVTQPELSIDEGERLAHAVQNFLGPVGSQFTVSGRHSCPLSIDFTRVQTARPILSLAKRCISRQVPRPLTTA